MPSLWFEVISPSEALFFNSLTRDLQGFDLTFTAAEAAETTSVLRLKGARFREFGSHPTTKGIRKKLGVISRSFACTLRVPRYDVALSFDNLYAVIASVARRRPAVSVEDNDRIERVNFRFTLRHSDFILLPEAFPTSKVTKLGIGEERIMRFPGYKEDIYIADFTPDPDFPSQIPFERYVVLRPEALFAVYLDHARSIVPALSAALIRSGFKVVFLPRDERERALLKPSEDVFVPRHALNGLDLCWHADGVMTGSGTLAREAALLGVKAVSFFPEELLAVDKDLVSQGKVYHSKDPEAIVSHMNENHRARPTFSSVKERSGSVRGVLLSQLKGAIETCLDGGRS